MSGCGNGRCNEKCVKLTDGTLFKVFQQGDKLYQQTIPGNELTELADAAAATALVASGTVVGCEACDAALAAAFETPDYEMRVRCVIGADGEPTGEQVTIVQHVDPLTTNLVVNRYGADGLPWTGDVTTLGVCAQDYEYQQVDMYEVLADGTCVDFTAIHKFIDGDPTGEVFYIGLDGAVYTPVGTPAKGSCGGAFSVVEHTTCAKLTADGEFAKSVPVILEVTTQPDGSKVTKLFDQATGAELPIADYTIDPKCGGC